MSKIKIILPNNEIPVTGKQISFIAPCLSNDIDGIIIDNIEFSLVDACKNTITDISNIFVEGAIVSVILDINNNMAYIQNAANTRYGGSGGSLDLTYLENKITKIEDELKSLEDLLASI